MGRLSYGAPAIPVFIALNHVLRTFTQHPDRPNYVFPLSDVRSYLAAKLFGAHLGDAIVNTGLIGGSAAHPATWMWAVAPVAVPLMILAAIATHVTARLSAQRIPSAPGAVAGRSQVMRRLAMWVFPCGVLVVGGMLPVGLLIYWVSNNVWTLVQQRFISGRLAAEDEQVARRHQSARRALAPRPGQRPTRYPKRRARA